MKQQKIATVANIFKFHTISTNPLPIKIDKLPINLYNSIQDILTNKLPSTTASVLTNSKKVYPFFIDKQQLTCNPQQHYICGYAISGNSGIDSQIVNSKRPQNIFHRTIHDVETIPLHFAFNLDSSKFNAILLTQTLGLASITRPLVNALLRELREIYKSLGYHVEQENITLRSSYIQQYLSNGKVKNITATDFSLSPNKTSNSTKQARCELGIFPLSKKHFLSSNFTKFLIAQDKTGLIGEIKNLTGINLYDFDKLKCSIKMGETLRTIDIFSPENTQLRFDLSHIKRQNNSCHPDLTTLLNEETKLIQELRKYIN